MKIKLADFQVKVGAKVDLKKWPTLVKPVYKSKEQYRKLLQEHVDELSSLQRLHYASNRYAVLLIFQAMDAAGKDGAIRHVMSGVNPQGCQVFSFKHPSAAELEHDFLWRTTRDLPERGRIGIFNRSYYEEVLIVRVHPEILRSQGLPDQSTDENTVWPSSTWKTISIATAQGSSSSFCTFPRKSSASDFLLASTTRTRTGNSVRRTSRSENSGSSICRPTRHA